MSAQANNQIQFIDLAAQQDRIRPNLEKRIAQVLAHGTYIMGPEVRELETKLAEFVGIEHCVSCSDGTEAIHMSLMALGIGPGDVVFVPSFTFVATAEVVSLRGAVPYFIDSDPRTFNIDLADLERAIDRVNSDKAHGLRPRAVIAVDLFGQPADYAELSVLCRQHGLFLIEDAAQAFGATYKGKRTCSFGDIATTSFFPAKPLGCYGDGGAIFCKDPEIAKSLRSIRVHGQGEHKYDNVRIGVNGRLDTFQAAILLAKFEVFEDEIKARDEVASRYTSGLEGVVGCPYVAPNRSSVWAQYTIRTERRDQLAEYLKKAGIPTAIYYPKPLHLQLAFHGREYHERALPNAESAACEVLSLPMSPYLKWKDQSHIVELISCYLQSKMALV